jgi:hypothetical protein
VSLRQRLEVQTVLRAARFGHGLRAIEKRCSFVATPLAPWARMDYVHPH